MGQVRDCITYLKREGNGLLSTNRRLRICEDTQGFKSTVVQCDWRLKATRGVEDKIDSCCTEVRVNPKAIL